MSGGEGGADSGANKVARWATLGVLVGASLFAYRSALFFQPKLEVPDSVEAWFFQAGDTSPQLAYILFAWMAWNRRLLLLRMGRSILDPTMAIFTL